MPGVSRSSGKPEFSRSSGKPEFSRSSGVPGNPREFRMDGMGMDNQLRFKYHDNNIYKL